MISKMALHLADLQKIRFLELMPKNGVVAEIGVHRGDFSHLILQHTSPEKLVLIDPWIWGSQWHVKMTPQTQQEAIHHYEFVKSRFASHKNVEIVREESVKAVSSCPDGYFDWVYIDGDHRYLEVKKDLEMWWPKVKEGGYLCGDDYYLTRLPPEVSQHESTENGVPRALRDFYTSHWGEKNFGLVYMNLTILGKYWAIYKKRMFD